MSSSPSSGSSTSPTTATNSRHVIVVGAGISGLACALRLQQCGARVTVFESAARVGGVIGSERADGFLLESGPQSFQGSPVLLDLVRELGLSSHLLTSNPRAPRYVLRHGQLRAIPMSPQAMLAGTFLGAASRWRIAAEAFRRTSPPTEDESVASFVRRKFGHEILEYLVSPFVSGVYAGDPEKLSLRAAFPSLDEWERTYGSVVRGAIKSKSSAAKAVGTTSNSALAQTDGAATHGGEAEAATDAPRGGVAGAESGGAKKKSAPSLCSFTDGVATLPLAMAARLGANLHTNATVVSISVTETRSSGAPSDDASRTGAHSDAAAASGEGPYRIRVVIAGRETEYSADAIVVAMPAYAAAHLLRDAAPRLAETLSGIAYAPVAVVSSGYQRAQIGNALDGFGFLVPRSENVRTLGTVWNTSLFAGRAPENSALLTSFIGGATDLEIAHLRDEDLARMVHADNARILDIAGEPTHTRVVNYPRALPQYNLGHGHTVETIRALAASTPGLFFAGNYLDGPALGKCIENGYATADAASTFLRR